MHLAPNGDYKHRLITPLGWSLICMPYSFICNLRSGICFKIFKGEYDGLI